MAEPIVKTTALEKYYKTGTQLVKALDGVDFEVKEREFVAIIGKSGSGKTTLLHMLGGLDTPTSGSVTVGGAALETLDNDRLAVFRRRKVGFIFQQYNLIRISMSTIISFSLWNWMGQGSTENLSTIFWKRFTFPPKRKCSRPCSPAVNSSGLPLSGP